MKCTGVQLSIKDEYLRTIQRCAPQSPPSDISDEIADTAFGILCREWSNDRPVRMITVTAINLVKADSLVEQIDLFADGADERREKSGRRELAVDEIRRKFGSDSILRASIIDTDLGIYKHKTEDRFKEETK